MDVFVARQPIFDRIRRLFAYELLFRSDNVRNEFDGSEAASATTQLIANSLLTIGWDNILGGKQAFINFDRTLLLAGLHTILPRENVVLEILETVTPDEEVIAACRKLHRQGYAIALDDFVDGPSYQALLEMANVIKVDVQATSIEEQQRLLKTYQPRGTAMLAEKVETPEDFDRAWQAGYDFFQGYFFARPVLVRGKQIPANKVACLKLLTEMQRPDLDFRRLEALVSEDVSLSYKLLRYANSARFYGHADIRSVKQALAMLGEDNIRHWVVLAAFPAMAEDKPGELVTLSLVRARFCERVAQAAMIPEYKLAFLMGLFSLLDALIDTPLQEALKQVSVVPAISQALLGTCGELDAFRTVYNLVCRYEVGDWEAAKELASKLNIEFVAIGSAYAESTRWAHQALHPNARTKESRRNARHAGSGTLHIEWQDGAGQKRVSKAKLLNVSVSGLRLQLAERIPIHACVSCDEPKLGICGTGLVRYCSPEEGAFVAGLEFKNGTGWQDPA
jgi:c-di-GMP-related signal transduction protein